jgi:starvation-inducible outer membrane lipoprotein
MSEKEISQQNVRLGGKIVKEKGRTNGELGNENDINSGKKSK